MSADTQRVLSFLKSKNISVQQDWVSACIEWLLSENQGNRITPVTLNDLVYEQWLMSDLQDISEACLPQNEIRKEGQSLLKGTFMLQVNYSIIISESAFSQYQKLKGQEIDDTVEGPETKQTNNETKWKFKSSRMIFLQLTDGITKLDCIEYHPIQALDADIAPGCKVCIKGPISCIDGLLLLERENIDILGGNSEDLCVKFSKASLLKASLGITDNEALDHPQQKKEEPDAIVSNTSETALDLVPLPDDEDIFDDLPELCGAHVLDKVDFSQPCGKKEEDWKGNPKAQSEGFRVERNIKEEGRGPDDSVGVPGRSYAKEVTKTTGPKEVNPFSLGDFEDDLDDFENDVEMFVKLEEREINTASTTTRRTSLQPASTENGERLLKSANRTAKVVNITGCQITATQDIDPPIIASETKISSILKYGSCEKYCVKGRVASLLTQLRTSPSYHLKVQVSDETGTLEATIDPAVITRLIGYTADELESYRNKHPRLRESVKQAVLNSQRKLASSQWIMNITQIEGQEKYSYRITEMTVVT